MATAKVCDRCGAVINPRNSGLYIIYGTGGCVDMRIGAEKKPVPFYEVTCCECESRIQYKKSEVFTCHIQCPVCGVSLWADTIQPVRYEEAADV